MAWTVEPHQVSNTTLGIKSRDIIKICALQKPQEISRQGEDNRQLTPYATTSVGAPTLPDPVGFKSDPGLRRRMREFPVPSLGHWSKLPLSCFTAACPSLRNVFCSHPSSGLDRSAYIYNSDWPVRDLLLHLLKHSMCDQFLQFRPGFILTRVALLAAPKVILPRSIRLPLGVSFTSFGVCGWLPWSILRWLIPQSELSCAQF